MNPIIHTPTRFIFQKNASAEIPDLLQTIFVSELIMPSRCLWIVSPWISNIPIIHNKANQFTTLEPSWARRSVPFAEVLAKLLEMGTTIYIATRPDPHNRDFIETLERLTEGYSERLHIQQTALLHSKGLVGDGYYLSGSMNFTFNGIFVLEESVQFVTDSEEIANVRIEFAGRWGGIS
jgi:hypothetical protein